MALPGTITYTESLGTWTGDPNTPTTSQVAATLAAEAKVSVTLKTNRYAQLDGVTFYIAANTPTLVPQDVYNMLHDSGLV